VTVDFARAPVVGWLLRRRALPFLLTAPTAAVVALVLVSAGAGIDHPGFNFGAVFTWVVWWGLLLLSLAALGRAWCLVCPIGAVGEWIQRGAFWGRSRLAAGFGLPWPRPLRNLWLATALLVVFVWLDNGYGMSNSPRLTAGLIVVLTLLAAWLGLLFERRAFCRYVCPLTPLLGAFALVAPMEVRRREAEPCRTRCPTKDCYRGNDRHAGCPMGEFPGAMDSNLHCIVCTECVRSCPWDNVALRLRAPGRDLWASRGRLDEAVAAATVVGLATVLPFLTIALLPPLRRLLGGFLPAGAPPNDPPRLVAGGILFLVGVAATLALLWGGSGLARWAAGVETVGTRALLGRYAPAFLPVGLAKFLADFLDHALRTWGALADVTRALWLDFPLNRAVPGRVTVVHLLDPLPTYALQVGLLLAGLALALYAMHRVSQRLYGRGEPALASFLPMAGLALVLTLVGVWTLGMPLL
jgi:ferredoxin